MGLRTSLGLIHHLALWVVVCLVAACPAFAKSVHPRIVGDSSWPLRADGERYAVYGPHSGVLKLLDARSHRSQTLPIGANCRVDAGAPAVFLVNCSKDDGSETPFVLQARTGTVGPVPGEGAAYLPGSDSFSSLGTQWLRGGSDSSGHTVLEYLNWHTGRMVSFGETVDDDAVPRDLNSTNLRPVGPTGSYQFFLKMDRFTVVRTQAANARLILRHTGRRSVVLDRCRNWCGSVSIGSGVVSWASGRIAHAYFLRSAKRLSWTFAKPIAQPVPGLDAGVQHTAKDIFFSVPIGGSPPSGYRLSKVPITH
jgi:hypothetical protein